MTVKKPLVLYNGVKQELASGDVLVSSGLFEIDISGGLQPRDVSSTILTDEYYQLDANGDIEPI